MKKINYISLLLLGFGFLACQSEQPEGLTKQGSLALLMDSRESIDISLTPIMKSEIAPTADVNDFHIVIKNHEGTPIVQEFDTFEELRHVGMPLLLPVGTYTAEASSGILPKAAFGVPCYRGEKQFIIEENTVSEVKLHCTPQSLKVTLVYTEEFHAAINADYKVSVTNGDGGSLEFTKEETRSGYFTVHEPMSLHLVGTYSAFGNELNQGYYLNNIKDGKEIALKKGDHLIVTLDVQEFAPLLEKSSLSSRSLVPSIKSIEIR